MRIRSRGSRQHYRTNSINMNELMHIILSLQIMFGSRRGLTAVILVVLLFGAGYFAVQFFTNPTHALEKADRLWDRDQHPEAIVQYKSLLRKRDPLDPEYAALPREERWRLYRRIISHEARYGSPAEARDWIRAAWNEGIPNLDFESEDVRRLWHEVTGRDAPPERNLLDEFLDRDR